MRCSLLHVFSNARSLAAKLATLTPGRITTGCLQPGQEAQLHELDLSASRASLVTLRVRFTGEASGCWSSEFGDPAIAASTLASQDADFQLSTQVAQQTMPSHVPQVIVRDTHNLPLHVSLEHGSGGRGDVSMFVSHWFLNFTGLRSCLALLTLHRTSSSVCVASWSASGLALCGTGSEAFDRFVSCSAVRGHLSSTRSQATARAHNRRRGPPLARVCKSHLLQTSSDIMPFPFAYTDAEAWLEPEAASKAVNKAACVCTAGTVWSQPFK